MNRVFHLRLIELISKLNRINFLSSLQQKKRVQKKIALRLKPDDSPERYLQSFNYITVYQLTKTHSCALWS
jgi:hypothetical protein